MNRFFAIVLLVLTGVPASAQEADAQQEGESEAIEEIVVIGGKRRGDPVDVEALYEEMLRERLMLEQEQLDRLGEEEYWRKNAPMADIEQPSRISWGYDPADELRMRRESNLTDVNFVPTKPASLFRIDF
jgi:hypothetical protein